MTTNRERLLNALNDIEDNELKITGCFVDDEDFVEITVDGKNTTFKVLRLEASGRGGGVEISLDPLGNVYTNEKMTAYQNYLGGGMLSKVGSDCTMSLFGADPKLDNIAKGLKMAFHSLTNPAEDTWEHQSYTQNQNLPLSAY